MDRGTHCMSVDREMPIKGILFSAPVLNSDMFHQYKFGKGFNNICLEYEVHVLTIIFNGSQFWLGLEPCWYIRIYSFDIDCPRNYQVSSFDVYLIYKNIMGIYES